MGTSIKKVVVRGLLYLQRGMNEGKTTDFFQRGYDHQR